MAHTPPPEPPEPIPKVQYLCPHHHRPHHHRPPGRRCLPTSPQLRLKLYVENASKTAIASVTGSVLTAMSAPIIINDSKKHSFIQMPRRTYPAGGVRSSFRVPGPPFEPVTTGVYVVLHLFLKVLSSEFYSKRVNNKLK